MSLNILNYLVCPEQTPGCSACLQEAGETLKCTCGKSYKKIEGLPALRHIDNQSEGNETQLFRGSKYYYDAFVSMFFLRQYGPLVEVSEPSRCDFTGRMFSRITDIRHGGEIFYQTLLSMTLPYLGENSVVLDVGCGTGRLTGELARKGVKFAIGLDYSPPMIIGATRVILSEKGETLRFKIRSTKTRLQEAAISGWGLKNCAFAIADAHSLPVLNHTADFISCINLLHRVRDPQRVIREIGRAIKPGGVFLVSNSYDWNDEYTSQEFWFDDFLGELNSTEWRMENEIDGVPYLTGTHARKQTLTLNHVQVFKRLS